MSFAGLADKRRNVYYFLIKKLYFSPLFPFLLINSGPGFGLKRKQGPMYRSYILEKKKHLDYIKKIKI
jgi:hypothetical protein